MIIPLTLPSGTSANANTLPPALTQLGSSELFLLELQGDLILSGDKYGQLVGHLTIDDNGKVRSGGQARTASCRKHPLLQGKPTLRIGYHLLEGTIVSMAKPLAVLQRVSTPLSPPDEDIVMHDGGEDPGAAATSYTIRTIVRKKIVFSKRPTPIVGSSAKIGVLQTPV